MQSPHSLLCPLLPPQPKALPPQASPPVLALLSLLGWAFYPPPCKELHSLLTGCPELPLGRELPITRSLRVGPEDHRGRGGQCRLEGTAGFPEVPPGEESLDQQSQPVVRGPKAPSNSPSSQDSDLWEAMCHVVSTGLATPQVLGTHKPIQPTHPLVSFRGSRCLGLISLHSPHRLAPPSQAP